jgi:hypothetical protein
VKFVRFTGALKITYNATSLITPGLVDLQVEAGATAILMSDGSGNWRVWDYLAALPKTAIQILSAPYTLTSTTSAQKLFNASSTGAITLGVGTYEFECLIALNSLSSSSGAYGFTLGGTATFTQSWQAVATKFTGDGTNGGALISHNTTASAAIGQTNTNTAGNAIIKGTIRVTVAGTVIPEITLGVAAATVVETDSYFKINQLSNSATLTTLGPWS